MKKSIKIILIVLSIILFVFLLWYFLFPASRTPVVEKVRDILPFGSGEDVGVPSTDTSVLPDDERIDEFLSPTARYFRISSSPVAGFRVVLRNGSTTQVVRYVERATGHIYDFDLFSFEKTRLTNTTIPKVYEAVFRSDGTSVIFRTLDEAGEIKNTSLSLTPPASTSTAEFYSLTPTNLEGKIGEMVSGQGNTLFFVLENLGALVSSNFSGGNLRTLYSSAFTNWRIASAGNNQIVYTKASSEVPGYAYILRSAGGLTKILGPLNALTVVPNSVGGYAYSYNDSGTMRFFVKERSTSEALEYRQALAEKCVWSREREWELYCAIPTQGIGRGEPDLWYQGITNFSDNVWYFDIRVNIAGVLFEPVNSLGFDMDIINPDLSLDEKFLIFMNKKDLSLWGLRTD